MQAHVLLLVLTMIEMICGWLSHTMRWDVSTGATRCQK